MGILNQLSSRVGDRTGKSNIKVAALCVDSPAMLAELAHGLRSGAPALVGDCAEVLTEVAKARPEEVVEYAGALVPLLDHRATRVRWEACHALALVSHLAPEALVSVLPRLEEMARTDPSIIVRDYVVDVLSGYAKVSSHAAKRVYPALKEALSTWDGKHAHHAWVGLEAAASACPEILPELRGLANLAQNDSRAAVRTAARHFLRVTSGPSRA